MKTELLKKLGRINTIPAGWKLTTVGKVCKIRNDLRKPLSTEERAKIQGAYPYYGPTGVLDFIDHHLVEGQFALIGEDGDHFLKPEQKAQTLLVNGKFNVNNHAHLIQGTEKCSSEWFFLYFHHRDITHLISRQGASRYKLNKDTLSKLPILVPPLNEQLEIYKLFTTWDNAIEKTEALISAKEKQFEWLLNNLIEDDFKSCKKTLSEYASIAKKEKILSADGEKLLTVKLHCKGIEPNTRDIKVVLSSKGRPYYQRLAGEFLIGRQNFHNGGFGIVPSELDGFIASNAITTLELNQQKLIPEYLLFHFSRKNYYLRVGHIMDGTGQKELSDKQIMKLPISAPSIKVQQDIVLKLSSAKEEIKLLQTLLDKYRSQKRGLMQKLLTGEWQVGSSQLLSEETCQELSREGVA
jgi:type I restriction enzyme S subunit